MRKFLTYAPAVLLFALVSCAPQSPKNSATDTFDTYYEMQIGAKKFRAKLAIFDIEKARGLMFVDSLAPDDSMLFVNDIPQRVAYWMKNTNIPLDIGFFDKNGILLEVKKLYPHNLNSVPSSRDDVMYCLETNAGWFEKNGIASSSKLNMELLNAAIKKRKN